MMLQVGDDGVVTSVNEEELVYVDKNELEQLIENYQQLEKENEQLKAICKDHRDHAIDFKADCVRLEKENEELQQFKDKVFELLHKKLEEYPYLTLSEKWDANCEYKHSCRENHEKNVAYASTHTLLNELLKELEE